VIEIGDFGEAFALTPVFLNQLIVKLE